MTHRNAIFLFAVTIVGASFPGHASPIEFHPQIVRCSGYDVVNASPVLLPAELDVPTDVDVVLQSREQAERSPALRQVASRFRGTQSDDAPPPVVSFISQERESEVRKLSFLPDDTEEGLRELGMEPDIAPSWGWLADGVLGAQGEEQRERQSSREGYRDGYLDMFFEEEDEDSIWGGTARSAGSFFSGVGDEEAAPAAAYGPKPESLTGFNPWLSAGKEEEERATPLQPLSYPRASRAR